MTTATAQKPQQPEGTTDEPSLFDNLVTEAQRKLKKHPKMDANDLFRDIVLPLLNEQRRETAEAFDDIDDDIAALTPPPKSILSEASEAIIALGGLADLLMIEAGFRSEDGTTFSEKCSDNVKQAYQGVMAKAMAAAKLIADADALVYDDGDDDDDDLVDGAEGDDDDDGAEVEGGDGEVVAGGADEVAP